MMHGKTKIKKVLCVIRYTNIDTIIFFKLCVYSFALKTIEEYNC